MLILVIGTSSSGKSTLARKLQNSLPGYWHYISLDMCFSGVPAAYGGGVNGPLSKRGFHYANKDSDAKIVYGNIGERILQAMIDGALAMTNYDINILFDDMLIDTHHAELWKSALSHIDHIVVRTTANQNILLARDKQRNNPPNLSLNHIASNESLGAHIICDTSDGKQDACVDKIIGLLADRSFDAIP